MINYTVKAGDTLTAIARKYGVTVQSIVDANGIDDPDQIDVGQGLIIPGTIGVTSTNPVTVTQPAGAQVIPGTGGPVFNLSDWLRPPKLYYTLAAFALGAYLFSRKDR